MRLEIQRVLALVVAYIEPVRMSAPAQNKETRPLPFTSPPKISHAAARIRL